MAVSFPIRRKSMTRANPCAAFWPITCRTFCPNCFSDNDAGAFVPDAEGSGKRSLRLSALSLLTLRDDGQAARALFASADNMTEQAGSLQALLSAGLGKAELAAFAEQWKDDRLVMDKWFHDAGEPRRAG